MKTIRYPDRIIWNELIKRPEIDSKKLKKLVTGVLSEIRKNGDKAVIGYTYKFDKVRINSLVVSKLEIEEAKSKISSQLKNAIAEAKNNIERFHISQKLPVKIIETTQGVKCWQKSVPIEKVGLYIPGGTAPLFSTVLMLGIPAIIAGCNEIVICSPPDKEGKIAASILYTADFIGIKKIFKIGGIQAIGAMAYGTESVPGVYKIFGPGNQYVTGAKQIVNLEGTAIDMPAGPSEVAVIADTTSNPSFVASDLLAQSEHGKDSQVVLVTTEEAIIPEILKELDLQLSILPRKEIAKAALENSKIVVLKNDTDLIDFVNEYAPEHLIISTDNPEKLGEKVSNAGSVFLGHFSPESAGDYASGTNHTLPTKGFAKAYSGVNLDSFTKKITFQQITENGIFNISSAIENMALEENLYGHKNSVTLRINKNK
jgi:histidinol dehydrogenase